MTNSFNKLMEKAKIKSQENTKLQQTIHGADLLPSHLIIPAHEKTPEPTNNHIAKFVRNEVDTLPVLPKVNRPQIKHSKSLHELLSINAKKKEQKNVIPENKEPRQSDTFRSFRDKILQKKETEESEKKITQAKSQIAQNRGNVLHGTGFTKKLAEKSSAFEKLIGKKIQEDKIVEKALEERFKRPLDIPVLPIPSERIIPEGLEYDRSQEIALHGMKKQKYSVLIGAAGTGKTTVVKQLIELLLDKIPTIDYNATLTPSQREQVGNEPDYDIAIGFGAFMGRAVQQMKKNLPPKYHKMCNTIHATLGYVPVYETYEKVLDENLGTTELKKKLLFRPTFTAENKLPFKVFVLDEGGTMPIPLWNELIAALPHDCRIFLIGDINQLTPVQGRSPLGFAMLKWPTYTLENIHRQAAESAILRNCHHVLRGEKLEKDDKSFVILDLPAGSHDSVRKVEAIVRALHKQNKFDPFKDAIITPQNYKELGQEYLNERFVNYFNPISEFNKRMSIKTGKGTVNYSIGDKIMLLQNDRRRGLTNGMTGIIKNISPNPNYKGQSMDMTVVSDIEQIDFNEMTNSLSRLEQMQEEKEQNERQASHITTVEFYGSGNDQEVRFETAGDYGRMQLGYAFTCHKMQGSECPTIVIVMHSTMKRSLYREWLYTAISRAQAKVIILTTRRAMAQALAMQKIRGDTIEQKAKMFIKLQDAEDTKLPNLPKPKELGE